MMRDGMVAVACSHGEADVSVSRDEARLRGILADHFASLWRFLRRLGIQESEMDDAVQDVIWVVARKMDQIAKGSERAYLLSTAYRVATTHRRARARRREVADEGALDLAEAVVPWPDNLADEKREREVLDGLLARLTPDLRAVFVMHEIEGLTIAEIAQALGLAQGTGASRLRRAREQFQSMVSEIEATLLESGGRA